MTRKKTYNAADPKQVAERQKVAQLEKDQHLKDLKRILNTSAGIRYFRRLMEDGKMFTTSFTGNSATFFNEGMRNLALKVFAEICEAAPDKLQLIILKQKEITDA